MLLPLELLIVQFEIPDSKFSENSVCVVVDVEVFVISTQYVPTGRLIRALSSVAPEGRFPAGTGDTTGPLTQSKVVPAETGLIVMLPELGPAQVTLPVVEV